VCNAHEIVSAVTVKRANSDTYGSRSCTPSGRDQDRLVLISQSGVESSGIPDADGAACTA